MRVITLARVPLGTTIARNALKHGSGALNIDGCRIGIEDFGHTQGRWPANLILDHLSACVCKGATRVKGSPSSKVFHEAYEGESTTDILRGVSHPGNQHSDADGMEIVEEWECVDSCPAPVLGTAARYFKQVKRQEETMATMPDEMVEYLRTLISPPAKFGTAVYISDIGVVDVESIRAWADVSIVGLIIGGTPSEEMSVELMRVLKPGAHLLLVAPEEEPTGHTGTCRIEDVGFEIRDSILWVREPGRFHYVAKTSRKERESGRGVHASAPIVTGAKAVGRKEGSAGTKSPRAGAGRTASTVHNNHPTLKPVQLMAALMHDVPTDLGPVVDPFMGCYDDKTEVLTREGWKKFLDVGVEDWFLTRKGQDLRYQQPLQIHQYPYKGTMMRFQSRSTDLLVTPNHNMWLKTHADFCASREARLIRADSLNHALYRIPSGGHYAPTEPMQRSMMYLLGLYVTEGYADPDTRYPNIIICQNQGERMDQIREWLAPFKLSTKGSRRISVRVSWDEYNFILGHCGKSKHEKFLSPTILSSQHLDALFEAMILGDGHRSIRDGSTQYWTVSHRLAGAFQELCLKLNFGSTLREQPPKKSVLDGRVIQGTTEIFNVCVTKAKHRKLLPRKHCTEEFYEGDVFCVTVPNHTLYVRRNGRTAWCGNSGSTGMACMETGHDFVGIEREEDYLGISDARIRQHDTIPRSMGNATIISDFESPKMTEEEEKALVTETFPWEM